MPELTAASLTGLENSALFGLGTGVLSALILVLDWLLVTTGRDSYLRITHGRRTPTFFAVWFFGGAIVGGLGSFIQLYEDTPQAALLVALTWRTFLDQAERFLNAKAGQAVEQEPLVGAKP